MFEKFNNLYGNTTYLSMVFMSYMQYFASSDTMF
jgi:hypothetical protein